MIDKKNIYYEFLFEEDSVSGQTAVFFLKTINKAFEPKWYTNEVCDFNDQSYILIENTPLNKTIQIQGKDDSYFIIGAWGQTRLTPRRFGLMWRYHYLTRRLEVEEINFIIDQPTFKIGFEQNDLYHFLQSCDDPQMYYSKWGLDASKLPRTKDFYDREIIDISKNPGRERFLPGIKFIPAFRIWFGQEAQDLFGRQKILDYPHSVYTKVLPNGVIEMQLMKDILKCDSWRNQWKQRNIVKYFGIEKLEVPKY